MPNRQFNPHHNPSAITAPPVLLDSPTTSYIDELLATTPLPPPGPAYYLARRKLWLTPRSPRVPCLPDYSASRQRLQAVLSEPNVVHDDDAWRSGIEKVWNGLSGGGKLKHRLPMSLIIKIVHAAWLRDETWPAGYEAPEPDDELADDVNIDSILPSSSAQVYTPTSHTDYSSEPAPILKDANDSVEMRPF